MPIIPYYSAHPNAHYTPLQPIPKSPLLPIPKCPFHPITAHTQMSITAHNQNKHYNPLQPIPKCLLHLIIFYTIMSITPHYSPYPHAHYTQLQTIPKCPLLPTTKTCITVYYIPHPKHALQHITAHTQMLITADYTLNAHYNPLQLRPHMPIRFHLKIAIKKNYTNCVVQIVTKVQLS